ncbi:MAG: threonine synthase [bacterium]
MKYVQHLECVICRRRYQPRKNLYTCPDCGVDGILDVCFDYAAIRKVMTESYLARNSEIAHWRYFPLLPLSGRKTIPSLRVGGTPLYEPEALRSKLGLKKLYVKDDGLNPTGSLKDRASSVGVARALEEGAKCATCASTGNAASSLAGNAASVGLKTFIFVPARAPAAKVAQLLVFGSEVFVVEGSYEDAFSLSMECAEDFGFYNRNSAINPYLVEGKKTVGLEIAEALRANPPDYVFASVGDGCSIYGVYKGLKEFCELGLMKKMPRLVGVQAAGAKPIYTAWKSHRPVKPTATKTLADSIAVGTPRNWRKGLAAVVESDGFYMTVSDREILSAIVLLGKEAGVFAEPAGAASFAGIVKAVSTNLIRKSASVACIVSGSGLKDITSVMKATGEARRVPPKYDAVRKLVRKSLR